MVWEYILAAYDLRNVLHGSAYEDDIERKLVPAKESLQQLPESLRALLANAFGLDMGFRDNTTDEQDELPVMNFPASTQYANSQKNNENRAYLFTTLCLNALLQDDYRAPHEMIIPQELHRQRRCCEPHCSHSARERVGGACAGDCHRRRGNLALHVSPKAAQTGRLQMAYGVP